MESVITRKEDALVRLKDLKMIYEGLPLVNHTKPLAYEGGFAIMPL